MSRVRGRNKRPAPAPEDDAAARVFSLNALLPQPASVDAPMVSFVERVSQGSRQLQRESAHIAPTSPIKRARRAERTTHIPPPEPNSTNSADDERYQLGTDHDFSWLPEPDFVDEGPPPPPPVGASGARRAVPPADPAMRDWMLNYRDVYLRALLRHEGRRGASDECKQCAGPRRGRAQLQSASRSRGVDGRILQEEQLESSGTARPVRTSARRKLPTPDPGVRRVRRPTRQRDSRSRGGLLPMHEPRGAVVLTAAPRRVVSGDDGLAPDLRHLRLPRPIPSHVVGGEKTSAYDFYSILEDMSDSTGLKPPGRYQVLLRMARQWRHLWLLMGGGRGHDPSGVLGTAAGELAIRCPACPQPGVNLPEGWENAAKEDRCLYVLFLALDACFRLKRRAVSSELKDPGLGTGWAYMVEWGPYRDYLVTVTDQAEISTCIGLAALDYANTKFSRGYATTGVGMGVCARHEFVQPNGVGDLQAGERYANMDYIFASLLRHLSPLLRKIVSYNIVCQWRKDLKARLEELPLLVRCNLLLSLFRFVIPKLHIKGHKLLCFLLFSLSLVPGSGQTDAEGIERCWASIGGAAASTKVCGPGARADQLDDHWHHWNWTKLLGLPALLRRRIDDARVEQGRVEQAENVPAWKAMVEAFEEDSTQKNPYEGEVKGKWMTESEVRNKLEEDEEREAAAGRLALHDVGPTAFMVSGLELEDEQRCIRIQAELQRTSTAALKINLRASRRKLERSIEQFRGLQATYTPGALVHLRSLKVASQTPAEEVPLVLPSALPAARRELGGCVDGLAETERALRDAQCRGTLVRLRRQLNVKARFLIYKKYHSRHQAMNTRSRTLIAQNESKILHESETYQMGWRALCALTPGGEAALSRRKEKERRARVREEARNAELLSFGLRPDDDDDLEDDSEEVGESWREMSWIWTLAGTAGVSEQDLEDALRIEWSKAYSRTRRWREEVRTLGEEQRRIPVSFLHQERVWLNRATAVLVEDGATTAAEAEGMFAYARAQADMYRALAMRAEATRTQPKLRRGQRRPREAIRVVSSWPLEGGNDDDVDGDEDDDGASENELEEDRVLDGDEEDM
ncbi:hypothetical protein GGX14DRAFT_603100 [Mycena pura]|uniref:CxC2-like cysteine cluster KDZ transposase-associated domain-containing protein n=1 Tax=Mycena pura TaxID=153505 RepID=A0AAD6UV05_9AGAR|nr:hypothetical protein GGX14DRAFT_603100 [Mycena pura]